MHNCCCCWRGDISLMLISHADIEIACWYWYRMLISMLLRNIEAADISLMLISRWCTMLISHADIDIACWYSYWYRMLIWMLLRNMISSSSTSSKYWWHVIILHIQDISVAAIPMAQAASARCRRILKRVYDMERKTLMTRHPIAYSGYYLSGCASTW